VRTALAPLIRQFGVQRAYRAASGKNVRSSEEAVRAVLCALGAQTDGDLDALARREHERACSHSMDPVLLAWNSRLAELHMRVSPTAARRPIRYELHLEAGAVSRGIVTAAQRRIVQRSESGRVRTIELAVTINVRVPFGYHELHVQTADGEARTFVISAPRRCYSGVRPREWGVFAPLYALREQRDQALGDLADLASLMQWMAQIQGDFVATLPISAAFLRKPFEPSPYAPASRLFWNEIYLSFQTTPTAAADSPLVDYRTAAETTRALLEPEAARFFAADGARSAAFREFLALYPDARDYASFRAAGERFEAGWTEWPERPRSGHLRAADYARAAMQFHLYAQFAAHQQLAAIAAGARADGVRLYLDLPLGVHSDSYDIWRNRDLFVTGASAGAPPDSFFTRGQNWGFPPPHPREMREQRYTYWRKVLQTQLRYAGILRLDHVMALHRLYVIPQGCPATQGVYIRYRADELYAVLTLESLRHQATIVGEDLGTVPAEVRKAMTRHGVKRMFVVQFEATDDEKRPLGRVPGQAVASLNTHDMPPFRAYWEGHDADLRRELELLDDAGVAAVKASRRRTVRGLSRLLGAAAPLAPRSAHDALVQFLARSPADMVLLNLEDLWLESEPQNVPGTSQERPNWRRRLKLTLAELRNDRGVRELLALIEHARRSATRDA
jgi:4-alpha-glucanotransferase